MKYISVKKSQNKSTL